MDTIRSNGAWALREAAQDWNMGRCRAPSFYELVLASHGVHSYRSLIIHWEPKERAHGVMVCTRISTKVYIVGVSLNCRPPHRFQGRVIQPGQLIHASVLEFMRRAPVQEGSHATHGGHITDSDSNTNIESIANSDLNIDIESIAESNHSNDLLLPSHNGMFQALVLH